jgi:hypothetical protein
MPQGRDHIYFLMDSANRFYYVSNGQVLVSTSPKPLQATPDGWRNIQITNQRNQKYFAVDRAFSLPLEFVKDGAQILKYLYYNRGIEEKVFLAIAKQQLYIDDTHYGYYYTLLYKGEIDFLNFQHDGPKVTANIMEGGIVKLIKANENTNYEVEVDIDEAVNVKMDGVKLKQKASYLITNGSLSNDLGGHTIDCTLLGNEAISSIGAESQTRIAVTNTISALWNTGQVFLQTGAAEAQITIEWDFKVTPQLAAGIGAIFGTFIAFQIHVLESDSSRYLVPELAPSGTNIQQKGGGDPLLLYNQEQHFQGSLTITVPANTRSVLYMTANNLRDLTYFTYSNEGTLNIQYTYTHPTTYIKALRPFKLLSDIIYKLTEGQYTVASDTLAEYQDIVVTCGDAIRGIEGAKIKTTLYNFFQAFNTVIGVGLGMVGNQLRFEKKSYWVDYSDPIDLGEVKNLKISPATDYIYNNIKIGYPEQEYEDVNGRQEFNNTHEYLLPVTRVAKTLEMVSPYRADCYGIEFTRINLNGKSTTDDKSDNDVFLIHIKDAPIEENGMTVYELDRELNNGATGLLEADSVFNLYLTPKHCLLRNGNYLHSLFYKQENKYIRFQTTEKNASVVTDVTENADVLIADLDGALFQPNLLDFQAKMPVNIQSILDINPVKAFTGTFVGKPFTGIIIKVSSRSADRASQDVQLLAAPDQDLTQFETING